MQWIGTLRISDNANLVERSRLSARARSTCCRDSYNRTGAD